MGLLDEGLLELPPEEAGESGFGAGSDFASVFGSFCESEESALPAFDRELDCADDESFFPAVVEMLIPEEAGPAQAVMVSEAIAAKASTLR